MNWHLSKKTGKVLRCLDRGSSSTDGIVNVVCFRLLPTIFELVAISCVFVFSFKEHILSVICISSVALYVIVTVLGTQFRLRFKKQTNDHDNKASEKAVDTLTNFETVKYFCTEDYELKRYMASITLFQSSMLATRGLQNAIVTAQQFVQRMCLFTCLYISALRIFDGKMSVGDFVAVTVYIENIFKPLDSLGNIYNTIVQSFVDMENLVELLQVEPDVKDAPSAQSLRVDPTHSTVEFKDVTFHYPSQPVDNGLKRVSFCVPTGQTYAIVGTTGAGKTTISRLLFRFYDVLSGQISINGQNITAVKQKSLRQNVGIVPQDTVMFNDTIRYNVRSLVVLSTCAPFLPHISFLAVI
jgi:ABC-type transport system involved in Fe-S cluster assembly fused permease/ATPase subunit